MVPGYDAKAWCNCCINKCGEELQRASTRISELEALIRTLTAESSRWSGEGPSDLYHGGQLSQACNLIQLKSCNPIKKTCLDAN